MSMKPTWRSSLLMSLGVAGVLILVLAECSVSRSGAEEPAKPAEKPKEQPGGQPGVGRGSGSVVPYEELLQLLNPVGKITAWKIKQHTELELSGMATAATGGYWGLNDSGNDPVIYRFDSSGDVKQVVAVEDATNTDWEAMAADPEGNLYLCDIGDNAHARDVKTIYRVKPPAADAKEVTPDAIYEFSYSDGIKHNCEAAFWFDGAMWLIAKNDRGVQKPGLFRLPELKAGAKLTAEWKGDFQIRGKVTDAQYDPSRNLLAVLTYHGAAFYAAKDAADLLKPAKHFTAGLFGQCEACLFSGGDFIVTNEPGTIWKAGLDLWQKADTVERGSANMPIPRRGKAAILDGEFDEYDPENPAMWLAQDEGELLRRAVVINHDQYGLWFGFEFLRDEPRVGGADLRAGDMFLIGVQTGGRTVYPNADTRFFLVKYVKEDDGKPALKLLRMPLDGDGRAADTKPISGGQVAAKKHLGRLRVEGRILAESLPKDALKEGTTLSFWCGLVEDHGGEIETAAWPTAVSEWPWEKPFCWGKLYLQKWGETRAK